MMELSKDGDGSDKHRHLSGTPPPRPAPPVAKKPKRSVPKKPAVAQKPRVDNKNQNGSSSAAQIPTENVSMRSTPTRSHVQDSSPQDEPSGIICQKRQSLSRPKDPPPPLPKVGPSVSSPRARAPPPLPRTPPRVSTAVKATPNKPLISPQASVDAISDIAVASGLDQHTINTTVVNTATDLERHSVSPGGGSNNPNTRRRPLPAPPRKASVSPSRVGNSTCQPQKENIHSVTAGSVATEQLCSSSQSLNDVSNVFKEEPPPVKPERCHLYQEGELPSEECAISGTKVCDNVSHSGITDKVVDTVLDNPKNDIKSETVSQSLSLDSLSNADLKDMFRKEDSVDDSSVKLHNYPAHSPSRPMNKAPPRVPPKKIVSSDSSNYGSSCSQITKHSFSCDREIVSDKDNLHNQQIKLVKPTDKSETREVTELSANTNRPIAVSRTYTNTKTSAICDQTDATSKPDVTREKNATPGPKKPVPAVRPRPTPKKRLSLCHDSAADETLGTEPLSNSVTDLSADTEKIKISAAKSKSEENIFKSTKLSVPKHSPAATSRRVYNDKGEEKQYRFIDKSVASRHMSANTEVNVLRSNDTVDASPSVTELRNRLKCSKESKSPSTAADRTVCDPKAKHDVTVEQDDNEAKHNVKNVKGSFEELLSDKSLLEPSSLLTEIEDILTRSFKHSSLTRSGSSPEKKFVRPGLLEFRHERSKSLACSLESTPVRPPRPKKEQKRLRSLSQTVGESGASDTESLPDLSIPSELSLLSDSSQTLGPAKPHPPKPKRHKLMKVQRSQSDVTAIKAFLDENDQTEFRKSPHKKQISDAGMARMKAGYGDRCSPEPAADSSSPKSLRKMRPSRKAPALPQIPPCKVTPPSPGVDIDMIIPVDPCVKSMKLHRNSRKGNYFGKKKDKSSKNSSIPVGMMYDTIDNEDVPYSSDDNHDYHEIADCLNTDSDPNVSTGSLVMADIADTSSRNTKEKRFPPNLPPRPYTNSQSFETSSQSSVGPDVDSMTGAGSSLEDISISSQKFRHYPKTSSPNVDHMTSKSSESLGSASLCPDSLSLPDSADGNWVTKQQPVSDVSMQSDTSRDTGQLSSSESDGEDAELKISRKKEKKLFLIAQEIASSERVFVDILTLLNVDFRKHVSEATERLGRPVIPTETLNRILDYLPQLQNFNEDLLKDLEDRIRRWDEQKAVADIFVKKGPFLKLYSSYIRDFETMTATLDDAIKKYPPFHSALKDFELSPRCASLALRHYMLKPIQRIPQYKMLLQDYAKHMSADAPDMKVMQTALTIVSEVADHANENMRHTDYVQKMLEIQRSLIGQFEVIKPGRLFLKEGELMKLSRKEMQPRYFFLFNDVLLYTTPVTMGYKLGNILNLAGMKVSEAAQDEYKMEFTIVSMQVSVATQDEYHTEFSIMSVQRSFALAGSNVEERDDWISALNHAIEENAQKRNTFEAVRTGAQVLMDKDFVLGCKAPLWIPDARVTMCMLCTCEFTVTWRRHHCRACGRIVCGNCSENKSQLRYLKYKLERVCDDCFQPLEAAEKVRQDEMAEKGEKGEKGERDVEEGMSLLSINGLFERFTKIRLSGRSDKKNPVNRPDRLKAVAANDEGASMSGYLQMSQKGKKWKRYWYVIKEKVLYTFKATQDRAAKDSMALLGYEVTRLSEYFEQVEPALLFRLSHHNTDPIMFRTDSATATERWVTVMRESTVA